MALSHGRSPPPSLKKSLLICCWCWAAGILWSLVCILFFSELMYYFGCTKCYYYDFMTGPGKYFLWLLSILLLPAFERHTLKIIFSPLQPNFFQIQKFDDINQRRNSILIIHVLAFHPRGTNGHEKTKNSPPEFLFLSAPVGLDDTQTQ